MQAFLNGIEAGWTLLLNCVSYLFNLHASVPILAAVLALWVLDRIFGIFKIIRG